MSTEFNKIDKRMPFTLPDGYFEQAKQCIYNEIAKDKRRHQRSAIIRWSLSAAAAIMVAITTFIVLHPTSHGVTNHDMLSLNNSTITDSTELYMTDEDLNDWVMIAENDMFITCGNELETN